VFQSFIFEFLPPEGPPKFNQINYFPNTFLHCEFELSMFSSLKVFILGGYFVGSS